MSHDDFAFEPMPGLPAPLPAGEKLLWQGTPDWKTLAVQAYHVRKIAAYFGVLLAWRVAVGLREGHSASAIGVSCLLIAGLGAVALGVLTLLAYSNARSTIYSITSKRVLLRHGVAVTLTMDVPFGLVDHAALKTNAKGLGDISLSVSSRDRVGYLIAWPHVRPAHFARPQPSLRALPDAASVSQILAGALAADAGYELPRIDARAPQSAPGQVAGQAATGAFRPLPAGPGSPAAA